MNHDCERMNYRTQSGTLVYWLRFAWLMSMTFIGNIGAWFPWLRYVINFAFVMYSARTPLRTCRTKLFGTSLRRSENGCTGLCPGIGLLGNGRWRPGRRNPRITYGVFKHAEGRSSGNVTVRISSDMSDVNPQWYCCKWQYKSYFIS